ncbi:MAG: lipopolysaccharide transport periplasmic protein LptA [Gammaproteobacteria bacterium]|nr:lipopolysaccharide transport periplasmic protein LptA [Gammaproteobacteria bacterium]
MLKLFFILILCVFTTLLYALSSDSEKPMQITSDASSFNYKTGVSQYDGNVEVIQGTARLNADRVITHNNDAHKISEAIAYGINKPAEYWTRLKKEDPLLHAIANTIKFYPQKSLVILEGNAKVIQGENTFIGPVAIYNMKTQTVTAPPSKTGRATVVINPDKI